MFVSSVTVPSSLDQCVVVTRVCTRINYVEIKEGKGIKSIFVLQFINSPEDLGMFLLSAAFDRRLRKGTATP